MKKPWSITTTTRSPYRLRAQLKILKQYEGEKWDKDCQKNFQISLIQNRLYGHTPENGFSRQFLKSLPEDQKRKFIDISHSLTFDEAKEIFNCKNYTDPAMRGRQSFNPFKKLGFIYLEDRIIHISETGIEFLSENYDLAEIFFRCFYKWQIPNLITRGYNFEDDYNIKPFIGVLHLIDKVNKKYSDIGFEPKGLSKKEFSLFCPTLINFNYIDKYADIIIELRRKLKGKGRQEKKVFFNSYKLEFLKNFLNTSNETKIKKCLKNLKDYGDNAIRYFRFTKFIFIRGNGYYVDLESRRRIEIENLLNYDDARYINFENKDSYLNYICDISKPLFPWETKTALKKITSKLIENIKSYEIKLGRKPKKIQNYQNFSVKKLKKYNSDLRNYRRELQNFESYIKSQNIKKIKEYINKLNNIFDYTDRSILLEKLSSLSLKALNDALEIQPNYPVGDDNEPTFTAPANVPDIECYYENFNAICEVTMLVSRDQWYNEGQPVMRHLRDFEEKYETKKAYCLFIAPNIHRDTLNTFWYAVKHGYEGKKQNIIPLTIKDLVYILKILIIIKKGKKSLTHKELKNLFNKIINKTKIIKDSNEWLEEIPITIKNWSNNII